MQRTGKHIRHELETSRPVVDDLLLTVDNLEADRLVSHDARMWLGGYRAGLERALRMTTAQAG